MLVLGAVCILSYLSLTGNTNQVFTDVVFEHTAGDGSNKSAEKNMFYLFSLAGILIYGLFFLVNKWGQSKDSIKQLKGRSFVLIALLTSFFINFIFYKKFNAIVICAIVVTLALYLKDEAIAVPAIAFMFTCVYALCGLYQIGSVTIVDRAISVMLVATIAFVITFGLMLLSKNEKLYLRSMLLAQLLVPFTLLVYLKSDYSYNGEIISIRIPARIQLFILVLIFAFVLEAIVRIKKSWKDPKELGDVLAFGTSVAIMAFNRFSGTGSNMPTDLHHYYENVIGYSQIFELGQKPFSEYIPVSGMYSVLHGAIFKIFGHGLASFYFVSTNIFYLLIILVIVFLLRKQLKAEWVLFISVLFLVTDYNRIALIVPIVLLLAWPKLIENKNLWLKAWFLTSYIHALYYPVFGAAVCFGFAPLGIWQIYSYAKSGQLLKDIKTVKFWGWWIVCFVPVIAGTGLLLGTVKHMLAMGSQTIFADGINRFAQIVPDGFLPFISNAPARLIAYYLVSYLILISIVWLSAALFFRCGDVSISGGRLRLKNSANAFVAASLILMFLVAFSYSVVRFDYNDIYSRSDGIVKAAFIVFIVVISRLKTEHSGNAKWLLGFSIAILSVVSAEGFNNLDSNVKLSSSYEVPSSCVYVATNSPRLGEGFIENDSYDYIMRTSEYMNTLDKNQSYMGIVDSFGLFYLCDMKGDSVMEVLNTIRGYGAVEETVENLRANNTIVGLNVSPYYNYYFYHWLLTSGDYIFDNNARLFIPNYDNLPRKDVIETNKDINLPLDYQSEDIGVDAGSLGSSLDTLKNIFKDFQCDYNIMSSGRAKKIKFSNAINGYDADYVYIEFEKLPENKQYILYDNHDSIVQHEKDYGIFKTLLKQENNPGVEVVLSWVNDNGEECTQKCELDEGKLLLPLGSRKGWLLNTISDITITVTKDGEVIDVPEIKDFRMLKLREVK